MAKKKLFLRAGARNARITTSKPSKIKILQDSRLEKEGKQFVKRAVRAKIGVGKKPTLTRAGSSRIKAVLKKLRGKIRKGETYSESISVKIRYRGVNGKMKYRWQNMTSKHPSDLDLFVSELEQGIQYTPKLGDTVRLQPGRGAIHAIKYEKILKEKISKTKKVSGAKAKPSKTISKKKR